MSRKSIFGTKSTRFARFLGNSQNFCSIPVFLEFVQMWPIFLKEVANVDPINTSQRKARHIDPLHSLSRSGFNNFIRFIQATPRRNLARRVFEALDAYLSMGHLNDPEKQSVEVNHE